ncbi:MAG: DNA repair protein RadA [Anaerolineae bacterium SM23_ 63]|nr:MAG: DNA repair protein RadA [Anaerolineae bacterium SM23_ 63]HEY46526.1 DNA repair protein RadA [Anaerolineae bacterium]
MVKSKTEYVCQQCGRRAAKALGRCPQCGAWNSMVAEIVTTKRGRGPSAMVETSQPMRLMEIEGEDTDRIPLPIHEFSRVLGGGVVPGSVVLIGGDPGIGKSTLLLQLALVLADQGSVLYISGEESERQIKNRVLRILHGGAPDDLYLLTETSLEAITPAIERTSPIVVVIDSIQTTHTSELDASAGSISQVRECASRLQTLAKSSGVAVFLVGHVTKEGAIAGPKVLEHIVDTVLYLEGDSFHAYRLLRSVKNRFGPTTEVGVFEMGASGMEEVPNPSETFLAERVVDSPGSAIAVTMEGTRPLLVEIQGLTSATSFGHPRRTANGVDFNRLLLTIAVLSRRVGLRLSDQDVFVNVVGGLRISEPAADLAVAAAISSSVKDLPLPGDVAFIGEVGLSGELRTVPQIPARLSEASKLGFQRVVIPQVDISADLRPESLQVIQVRSLREALAEILRS